MSTPHPSAPHHPPTPASNDAGLAVEEVIARARRRRRAVWGPLASTWVPILVSAAIHAGLLGCLGLIVWRVVIDEEPSPEVRVSFDDPGLASAAVVAPTPLPVPEGASVDRATSPTSTPLSPSINKPSLTGMSRAGAIANTEGNAEFAASTDESAAGNDILAPGAGALAGLFEDATPVGAPGTEAAPGVSGRPVDFGGLGSSSARSVVYVVDASGPMVTSLPLVIAAVERSVAKLSPSQKFGVVLFRAVDGIDSDNAAGGGGGGTEMFTPILVRATPLAKQRLSAWLRTIKPMGRSNPLDGLEHALGLAPEAVFLLSRSIDRTGGGVWDQGLDSTLDRLNELNPIGRWSGRRAVTIKTIQFLDEDPTGIMQAIGERHSPPSPPPPPPSMPTKTTNNKKPSVQEDPGYTVVKRAEDL